MWRMKTAWLACITTIIKTPIKHNGFLVTQKWKKNAYAVERWLRWRFVWWRRNSWRVARSIISGHVHFHVFGDQFGRDADALEDVHFGRVAVEWIFANDEDENVVVQIFGVDAGESCRLDDEVQRETFHHFAVLEILNGDPLAVQTQHHLLCPDAGRLLHVQQSAHTVRRVHDFILLRNGERGQVLHNKTRPVIHIRLRSSAATCNSTDIVFTDTTLCNAKKIIYIPGG